MVGPFGRPPAAVPAQAAESRHAPDLGTDGPLHDIIKIKPPMVLTADDVDMVIRACDDELTEMARCWAQRPHEPTPAGRRHYL